MRTAALALLLAAAAPAPAQLVGSAPVEDFALPVFGADGRKVWELRGARGFYRAEGTVDLDGMNLRFFEPDGATRLEMSSGRASLDLSTRLASGAGGVHLAAPLYVIRGTDWTFDGPRQRITIAGGVRATFFQDLGPILD